MTTHSKNSVLSFGFTISSLAIAVVCGVGWAHARNERAAAAERERGLATTVSKLEAALASHESAEALAAQIEASLGTLDFGRVELSEPEELQRDDPGSNAPPAGPLAITITADEAGHVAALKVGLQPLFSGPFTPERARMLDRRLTELFGLGDMPFDGIGFRIEPNLKYHELLKIITVCARQHLPDGTPVKKFIFSERSPES